MLGIGEGVPMAESGTGWALRSFPTRSCDFVKTTGAVSVGMEEQH